MAQAQSVNTQFWPELETYLSLNDSLRLFVPLSATRSGVNDSEENGTVGAYLDYFTAAPIDIDLSGPANEAQRRRLQFRVGYGYTASRGPSPASNTIDAEMTYRVLLPLELLLAWRNRFDLNFTTGEFDPRYRTRFQLERGTEIGRTTLVPYASGELFYGFNEGKWIKTRVTVGLEVQIWERFVPEVYVQRDYSHVSGPDINGVGLVFNVYFR